MKITFDGQEATIQTSEYILKCNDSEEGIVISPEHRTKNLMEICMIHGGQKFIVRGNIMWIQVIKEQLHFNLSEVEAYALARDLIVELRTTNSKFISMLQEKFIEKVENQ